jgi:hypothetical protein
MRDSCVFYRSFYEAIKELDDEHQLQIYNAIFQYSLDFQEPELHGISSTVFKLIKPQLESNIRKYRNGMRGADMGKMGGRPTATTLQNNPTETPRKPHEHSKLTPNDNDNANVNDNDNDNGQIEAKKLPVFVSQIADKSEPDFIRYIEHCHRCGIPIQLKPEFASKANTYYMLVQSVPLFAEKLKYIDKSDRQIKEGIKAWLKYNTVSKVSVEWSSFADMAQHCINFIKKHNDKQ